MQATKEEKDLFEILHRKRRNRVEHFFARLECFNFKDGGCVHTTFQSTSIC